MNDDYLWDGSGEPDPEVQKLEASLRRFRFDRPAPKFAELATARPLAFRVRQARGFTRWAAVAAAVLAVAALWFTLRRPTRAPLARAGWEVSSLAGTPHVGGTVVIIAGGTGKLIAGQTLETDHNSRASITDDETGQVEIEPDTRLRVMESGSARKRLALDLGTIHASIWAPPGEFVVDTPSAVTVDLGCAYTLHVDASGAGLVRTTLGWVGFEQNGRESFIPAGAACSTRPHIGPGTPYYEDAPQPLREALTRFDFESETAGRQSNELTTILARAGRHDALTLWHLLSRVSPPDRGRVYDRLASFAAPPAGVTREGILRLDQPMLDAWWGSLGLGDISLWRTWERSWSQHGTGPKP